MAVVKSWFFALRNPKSLPDGSTAQCARSGETGGHLGGICRAVDKRQVTFESNAVTGQLRIVLDYRIKYTGVNLKIRMGQKQGKTIEHFIDSF